MDKNNPAYFLNAPQSEGARLGRNNRVALAQERSWDYFCTQGDPANGHRIPIHEAAVNMAMYVGASTGIVEGYIEESCGTGWEKPGESEHPFEKEMVTVAGSPTGYYRPRDQKELQDRLRQMKKLQDRLRQMEEEKALKARTPRAPRKPKGGANA